MITLTTTIFIALFFITLVAASALLTGTAFAKDFPKSTFDADGKLIRPDSGHFAGRGFGVTIERPARARITKLFARELGGSERVSFNLFITGGNNFVLKPCEMSTRRVIDFVLHFEPDNQNLSIGSFEKEA